jgi:hypothetical protein
MKSVYVESSVISYLTARLSRDVVTSARQNITSEWWESCRNLYDLYISELVIEEISSGDTSAANARLALTENIAVLVATDNARELAKTLLTKKAIPATSVEDAMHISIAAVQGVDFLITWNFKHINNANTRQRIESVIQAAGYTCPVLCSPEELISDE